MALGPLVAAAGYLLMSRVDDPFNFWTQLLPGLMVFGLGLSMTVSPLTAAILAAVDPGAERDRFGDQQRDLPHRRADRDRLHGCDRPFGVFFFLANFL